MNKTLWVLFIAVWSLSAQGCMLMQVSTRADAPAKPHHNHGVDKDRSGHK